MSLSSVKVLLIENEPELREAIVDSLEYHLVLVTPCTSVDEALQTLQSFTPDCIVCNIAPTQTDCLSFIRYWRQQEVSRNLEPISAIILFDSDREIDSRQARQAGFQAILAKPFKINKLLQTIAALVTPSSE